MNREFTGRDMAFLTVAFFAVVVSVNVLMAVIANGSWTGLVVQNSYVASQQFNGKTAELERAAAMDVHATLSYQNEEISIVLRDSSGAAVKVAGVSLNIGRPSHEGEDRILQMACSADGLCRAPAHLGPGVWTGEVSAELSRLGPWSRAVRLFVMEGQPG
jgi:nitrogen fixation protein FixH